MYTYQTLGVLPWYLFGNWNFSSTDLAIFLCCSTLTSRTVRLHNTNETAGQEFFHGLRWHRYLPAGEYICITMVNNRRKTTISDKTRKKIEIISLRTKIPRSKYSDCRTNNKQLLGGEPSVAYITLVWLYVAKQDRKYYCVRTYLFLVSDYCVGDLSAHGDRICLRSIVPHKACQCVAFFSFSFGQRFVWKKIRHEHINIHFVYY